MAQGRPHPKGPKEKADAMQAALQVDAFYEGEGKRPALLNQADAADPIAGAAGDVDATYDEHEWDDVVQQTFPASDPPPPCSRTEKLDV